MNKNEIRQVFLEKRKQLSASEINVKSQLIANNFVNNLTPVLDLKDKKLAFYIATNNEADPQQLIKLLENYKLKLALPVIAGREQELLFRKYEYGDSLVSNSFYKKLLEPSIDAPLSLPEIILVPLVAFDQNCHRIGMGGGFYDRTINHLRQDKILQPVFIGLAYDFQYCRTTVNFAEYDQQLDFIVSESNIFRARF